MAANSNGYSFFWDRLIPFFYSVGASVVIVGALGKIMHYDWADVALPLGLGTEAIIFLIYALESILRKPSTDYDWEKVYPELSSDYNGAPRAVSSSGNGLTSQMDNMLASANLSPELFSDLKNNFQKLNASVSDLSTLNDASVATEEYATNVKAASSKINEMNSAYGVAVNAMNSMADATKDAEVYRNEFQKVTQNLGALNSIYELELQDANKHLKAMNSFYGNLSSAMDDMSKASKETEVFTNQLAKLTDNIQSLNGIYGNMLSAMRGSINQ